MITRNQVLHNANTDDPLNSLRYSMTELDKDGYRRDCSGQVSKWFRIPADFGGSWGGLSTVTMVTSGLFVPIPASDLQPADVVGIMGEGTGGADGHVRLFLGWDRQPSYLCREQGWGTHGPDVTTRNDLQDFGRGFYRAYRYTDIQNDPVPPAPTVHNPGTRTLYLTSPMMTGDDVQYVQKWIGPKKCGPTDGIFGPMTKVGVMWYQRMRRIQVDGIVGPITWRNMRITYTG